MAFYDVICAPRVFSAGRRRQATRPVIWKGQESLTKTDDTRQRGGQSRSFVTTQLPINLPRFINLDHPRSVHVTSINTCLYSRSEQQLSSSSKASLDQRRNKLFQFATPITHVTSSSADQKAHLPSRCIYYSFFLFPPLSHFLLANLNNFYNPANVQHNIL